MQTKTIKKLLDEKMKQWVDSIENKSLAKRVEDNLIVTGGSIASLLLGEKVNDFDVYIEDPAVLEELVLYYVVPLAIPNCEVFSKYNRPKINILETPEGEDILNQRIIAISTLKDEQVKVFMPQHPGGWAAVKSDENESCELTPYKVLFISPNAITLSGDIQIVTRFTGDAKSIHKNFDFVHATNYYTTKDGLMLNQPALESLLTKQLRYTGSLYPVTSIFRMKKFILRDWKINAGEILKILFQVSELDLKDFRVLEEQLVGVDVAYFALLIEALQSIRYNPDKLTSLYINSIIDKIFND